MSQLREYAFIVKHDSYSSINHKAELVSDVFKTKIIGVSSVKESVDVINVLIDEGIQLVELCGGFTEDEKRQIKNKIKEKLPIGLVRLDSLDVDLLDKKLK